MNLAMWTPGPLEIIVLLVIVLVIFGPKRLPDLGRSLGRGMREFKDSVTGKDKDEELSEGDEEAAGEQPQVKPPGEKSEPAPGDAEAEPAAASKPKS
jgi:sec-independent protein translocase protein TatA